MAQVTHLVGLGAVPLKAAGLIAADTTHPLTPTIQGGAFDLVVTWTACEVATTDEFYGIQLEANTDDATSTWTEITPVLAFGASVAMGGAPGTPAAGTLKIGFRNPKNHQIRAKTYVAGTIATGFNFALDVYPINDLGY